ncbi:hypothetical protein C0033_17700 [Clostridium sp. chh4-2]|uniref:acyltransferase family protein n=1 Tax=Clostridium sp. chh4-2 TaxID=2067550 RepID=UPI000CCEC3C1|nr:acyltransferase family protein [Clostridium sp. chh4-2]PNV60599.1 hypothetical protein C0033_17700 [Clostridium sp. chh4-2]
MNRFVSYKISWMTFICNIIILLHHANLRNYINQTSEHNLLVFMDFFSALSRIAMVWFFFISAYLFFRTADYKNIPIKWKSRAKSLLIPYIIWNTIAVLFMAINGSEVLYGGIWGGIRNNYLFLGGYGSANGPLWYIFRLLEYVILAPLFLFIIKRKILFYIVEILLYAYIAIMHIGYFDFLFFVPIYLLGGYISKHYSKNFEIKIETEHNNAISIICLLSCVLLSLWAKSISDINLIEMPVLEIVLRNLIIIPILGLLLYSGKPKALPNFIKNGGMLLYCMHDLFYRFFRIIFFRLNLDMWISWFLMVFLTIGCIYMIWIFLNKNCPRLLAVFVGGRL